MNGDEPNEELTSAIKQEFNVYDPNKMSNYLEEPGYDEVYLYLTQSSMGFSFPVIHAIGDYANFEVEYSYLEDFLKLELQ